MIVGALVFFIIANTLLADPHAGAAPLEPASDTGPCSLAQTVPATIVLVDDDFDLLLDDGRRVALAGIELPSANGENAKLHALAWQRLSNWLAGAQVYLAALAPAPDRWGRLPAQVIAAADSAVDSPYVSVGAIILTEGLARFRPDPAAASCSKLYLDAEGAARNSSLGLWANDPIIQIGDEIATSTATLLGKKGMAIVAGTVNSVGETKGSIYLNLGRRGVLDFAVMISQRNLAIFEKVGVFPRALRGQRVRVRGLIETNTGPRMEIASPAELELLDRGAAQ